MVRVTASGVVAPMVRGIGALLEQPVHAMGLASQLDLSIALGIRVASPDPALRVLVNLDSAPDSIGE